MLSIDNTPSKFTNGYRLQTDMPSG